jgi:hypothetical protein
VSLGRDGEFEEVEAVAGFVAGPEEGDMDVADANEFAQMPSFVSLMISANGGGAYTSFRLYCGHYIVATWVVS